MHKNHSFSGALLHILQANSVNLDFFGSLDQGHSADHCLLPVVGCLLHSSAILLLAASCLLRAAAARTRFRQHRSIASF